MAEIPTEALEAAAQVIEDHDLQSGGYDSRWAHREAQAVLTAAAPYLIAEGRRQVIAELRQLATPAGPLFTPLQIVMFLEGRASVELPAPVSRPDDRDRLMARYERELRAKIAGEIRARSADVARRAEALAGSWDAAHDHPFFLGCEWSAKIAEGGDGG